MDQYSKRSWRVPNVAVLAAVIVVCVTGTALADPSTRAAIFSKKETAAIKKIATSQANAAITARAKKLTVNKAKTADSATTATSATSAETAKSADSAKSVVGQTQVNLGMSWGQSATLLTNGSVSVVAQCRQDNGSGQNSVRLLASTTASGSFTNDRNGPAGNPPTNNVYLEPNTPEDDREIAGVRTTVAGQPLMDSSIDAGFVAAPDGSMIRLNADSLVFGLNVLNVNCHVRGTLYTD
jgi:hypothetical protein